MPEIRFYHLMVTPLEKALPKLLEKIIMQGHHIVVLTESEEQTDSLNTQLWTYHPSSFLPHGSHKDGFIEDQPIFLTHKEENPNHAQVLIVLNGKIPAFIDPFKQVLDLFEDGDGVAKKFEEKWETYQRCSLPLTYWRQQKEGTWEKIKEHTP